MEAKKEGREFRVYVTGKILLIMSVMAYFELVDTEYGDHSFTH